MTGIVPRFLCPFTEPNTAEGQGKIYKYSTTMRALTTLFFLLFNGGIAFAQRANRYNTRSYDIIGFPKGDEIVKGLLIALPFLIIGFLIAYFFLWRKSNDRKSEDKSSSTMGCFGIILMGIGIFCTAPLWPYLEAIWMIIASVVFLICLVAIIWQWITSKE